MQACGRLLRTLRMQVQLVTVRYAGQSANSRRFAGYSVVFAGPDDVTGRHGEGSPPGWRVSDVMDDVIDDSDDDSCCDVLRDNADDTRLDSRSVLMPPVRRTRIALEERVH